MSTQMELPMAKRAYTNKALRSFFGARSGGQDRPQDVFTPQFLIDAILEVWPEGIALDPCASKDAIVPAERYLYEAGEIAEWPDRTYLNPPYAYLKRWCQRLKRGHEHMLLAPTRTNRAWVVRAFWEARILCWLKPFPFRGHEQAFPVPVTMAYYGERTEAFREAFAPHGELVRVESAALPLSLLEEVCPSSKR